MDRKKTRLGERKEMAGGLHRLEELGIELLSQPASTS